MIRSLLILTVLATLWVVLLWFGIAPDFSAWSPARLAAFHVLPPLGLWTAGKFVRHRWRVRKERAAESAAQQALAENNVRLDAARKTHDEELDRRRQACDCRCIALSDLVAHGAFKLPEADHVGVNCLAAGDVELGEDLLDTLRKPTKDALRQIYVACGAAAVLPIYIQAPTSVAAAEAIALVGEINRQLVDELALPFAENARPASVTFFYTNDSVANGIVGLFEKQPDLPGAIILAFDSPLIEAEFGPPPMAAGENGAPSHGATAILVTHRDLPAMLKTLNSPESRSGEDGAMTPYWNRSEQPEGRLALLLRVPPAMRSQLAQLPVIGCIHHTAGGRIGEAGIAALTSHLQRLLERAQINAELLACPFTVDSAGTEAKATGAEDFPLAACHWLVHNAGQIAVAGERLVAIGMALSRRNTELNPIDSATNVIGHIGNLGQGQGLAMLAIALARVVIHEAPVLTADFQSADVSVGFVMPSASS